MPLILLIVSQEMRFTDRKILYLSVRARRMLGKIVGGELAVFFVRKEHRKMSLGEPKDIFVLLKSSATYKILRAPIYRELQ